MITSLSPRICCTVAMAPALTEAASEARIRLTIPKSPPLCSLRPVPKAKQLLLNHKPYMDSVVPQTNGSLNGTTGDGILNDARANITRDIISVKPRFVNNNTLDKKVNGFHFEDEPVETPVSCAVNRHSPAKLLHSIGFLTSSMNKSLATTCKDVAANSVPLSKASQAFTNTTKFTISSSNNCLLIPTSDTIINSSSNNASPSRPAICTTSISLSSPSTSTDVGVTRAIAEPIHSEGTSCSNHDLQNRFTAIERRTQHLVRRLRFMRTKNLEQHVQQQIGGYIDTELPKLKNIAETKKQLSANNTDESKTDFKGSNVKNLSTSALVEFVRKYQTQNVSAASQLQLHNNIKGIKSEPSILPSSPPELSPKFTPNRELRKRGREFSSVVTMCAKNEVCAFDADATESSSGGESCDESPPMVEPCRDGKKHIIPLSSRSDWRWSSDRASIISRWTWLQAQVSDLEYRIRQQTDIYRQIRSNKGSVTLGESTIPHDLATCFKIPVTNKTIPHAATTTNSKPTHYSPACNISNVVNNIDRQSSRLSQSLGNCLSPNSTTNSPKNITDSPKCPNGFIQNNHSTHTPSCDSIKDDLSSVSPSPDTSLTHLTESPITTQSPTPSQQDTTCQSARCRPIKTYRKRKLLRSAGLHQVSRKAQRLSTVSCQCYPPQTTCVLCSGRYNNTQLVDAVMMPFVEKVSLLDPSFHPVLSFNYDVPLSVYLDSLLKFGSWHKKNHVKVNKKKLIEKKIKKYSSPLKEVCDKTKKKYTKKPNKSWVLAGNGNKIRKKFEKKPLRKLKGENIGASGDILRDLATVTREYTSTSRRKRGSGSIISTASSESSGRRTPGASPNSKDQLRYTRDARDASAILRRKMAINDYDIDNIVIPYSMAASTRVERLQYKEIDTPKWREIPEYIDKNHKNMAATISNHEEVEDISDESYQTRHLAKQLLEKKRFINLTKYSRRISRGSRGGDTGPAMDHISSDLIPSELTDRLTPTLTPSDPNQENHSENTATTNHKSRSNSISHKSDRSSIDDIDYLTDPWPTRQFPLDDTTYTKMVNEQPSLTVSRSPRRPPVYQDYRDKLTDKVTDKLKDKFKVKRSTSPVLSSASSVADEDPQDPEWSLPSHEIDELKE